MYNSTDTNKHDLTDGQRIQSVMTFRLTGERSDYFQGCVHIDIIRNAYLEILMQDITEIIMFFYQNVSEVSLTSSFFSIDKM